ncbi:YrrS family protein [Granulicatella seriolae]|uniref:YrrS family protein n=1 Tax=Granulicatella seriolae TaxID=2967226 RepID=A0ABT1WKX9_9LACT|nr:YrrS family protein [Granulicatella seriolae]
MSSNPNDKEQLKKLNNWLIVLLFLCTIAIAFVFYQRVVSQGKAKEESSSSLVEESVSSTSSEAEATVQVGQADVSSTSQAQEVSSSSSSSAQIESSSSKESSSSSSHSSSSSSSATEASSLNIAPVGTAQTGEHVTNYEDGSQDRIEIKKAYLAALGNRVTADTVFENWIGNGGDNRVEATVTDTRSGNKYIVFMQWVDGKGWKPESYKKID